MTEEGGMSPECQLLGTLGCHLCEVAEQVMRSRRTLLHKLAQ